MKIKSILSTCALTIGLITSTTASEATMTNTDKVKKATFIKLESTDTKNNLGQFLQKGAQLVRQTEPNTPFWFALKEKDSFAIFDVFPNELKENAEQLVQGGWENGVLKNVSNFDVIATNHFNNEVVLTSKDASYIVA